MAGAQAYGKRGRKPKLGSVEPWNARISHVEVQQGVQDRADTRPPWVYKAHALVTLRGCLGKDKRTQLEALAWVCSVKVRVKRVKQAPVNPLAYGEMRHGERLRCVISYLLLKR